MKKISMNGFKKYIKETVLFAIHKSIKNLKGSLG